MDYSDTTVMIPVKNEPATEEVAKQVLAALPGCQVIVIYKGQLKMRLQSKRLRVIKQTGIGKGTACRQAAKEVKTPIMCLIDGDNTYSARDLCKLIAMIRKGADMAIGNRIENMDPTAMPGYIVFGNNILTSVANILYGMHLKDSQTGLRAIRKEVFDSLDLKETGFGIEEEMNIKTRKHNYKVVEAPISYAVRTGESKQMKVPDGIRLLLINFKFLFQ
jgi:BMFP domain-containing protein YqiC